MSIFAPVPDQIDAHRLLVLVEAGRTTLTYAIGQKIYRHGDPAETVCFVQHGSVELTLIDGDGCDFVIGAATEGQFFGATCLDGVAVRITSATALTQCRITCVTKHAMLSAINDRPKFAKMFTDRLWYNNAPSSEDLPGLLSKLAALQ